MMLISNGLAVFADAKGFDENGAYGADWRHPFLNASNSTLIDLPVPKHFMGGRFALVNGALVPDAEWQAVIDQREAAEAAKAKAANIETLWQAADKYVSGYISGVAVGILTIGVLQQKPKCLAVTAWSGSIWTEYYVRKAGVTETQQANLDFSSFGPMPHTVPELQAEVGL